MTDAAPSEEPELEKVQVSLVSPESLRSLSYGEVKEPATIDYRTNRPAESGLFCTKIFGPLRHLKCQCGQPLPNNPTDSACERCGVTVAPPSTRMGHIALSAPVVHTGLLEGRLPLLGALLDLPTLSLKRIIYLQDYVVIDPGSAPLERGQSLAEEQYREARERHGDEFDAGMGAESVKKMLQRIDLYRLAKDLRADLGHARSQRKTEDLQMRLSAIEALRDRGDDPVWMVLEVVPVIPPFTRPITVSDAGDLVIAELNDVYRRLINRNSRLKKLMDLDAPEVIIRNEKRMLQQCVDALIADASFREFGALTSSTSSDAKANQGQESNMKSIQQLANSLSLDAERVSNAARELFALSPAQARDLHYNLSPHQCEAIRRTLIAPKPQAPEAVHPRVEDLDTTSALALRADPLAGPGEINFREMNRGIWFHLAVTDELEREGPLRRRLGIVLQHLAAHGRTSVVKGCSDKHNHGWLRSPLGGGSNGMQYYLWWAPQGSRPTDGLGLSRNDVVVRAVRHHDDHTPLAAGELTDYEEFRQPEIEDEDLVGRPWTADQIKFVESVDPVRVVQGHPGSGKTTVLWRAVEARSQQRVLYLTWSGELTRQAKERFNAFAPVDAEILALDFASFLGQLCGHDVQRVSLENSRARFAAALDHLGPSQLGPWANNMAGLYAEVRAHLLGHAHAWHERTDDVDGVSALQSSSYQALRSGARGVGPDAARVVLSALKHLTRKAQARDVFPELHAATHAAQVLRDGPLPEALRSIDRIVVDEVQDLTLLEFSVVIELCRAIARERGHAPWLLIAGDEGQTVRPSGFRWGPLSQLLSTRVGTPTVFALEENLRCPQRIAEVVERATANYGAIEKGRRPAKQRKSSAGQHVDAQLLHAVVPSTKAAIQLLDELQDLDGVVVVCPSTELPEWVPASLRQVVLTPSEAKGLEYQSVCILDAGRTLSGFDAEARKTGALELHEESRRTAIDQLRVALSRATDSLAVIDVSATEDEVKRSRDLLGDATPLDADDLVEHFTDADLPAEERVLSRTKDARALVDERPRRAWRRAFQAVCLLGNPALPNGVPHGPVRVEARKTLLATAARLLLDGDYGGMVRQDVVDGAREASKDPEAAPDLVAFELFEEWASSKDRPPFRLLDGTLELGTEGEWLRSALERVAQRLRGNLTALPMDPSHAHAFSGDVEAWLGVVGSLGDIAAEARDLRCKAFDSLLEARRLAEADDVLEKIHPEDLRRTALLRESQGRHEEAGQAYERAGLPEDALRNWRSAGDWERALPLAAGEVEDDLRWLAEVAVKLESRPEGHADRLTTAERVRLTRALDAVRSAPDVGGMAGGTRSRPAGESR